MNLACFRIMDGCLGSTSDQFKQTILGWDMGSLQNILGDSDPQPALRTFGLANFSLVRHAPKHRDWQQASGVTLACHKHRSPNFSCLFCYPFIVWVNLSPRLSISRASESFGWLTHACFKNGTPLIFLLSLVLPFPESHIIEIKEYIYLLFRLASFH